VLGHSSWLWVEGDGSSARQADIRGKVG
jgi:hypothetical protein